VNSTTVAVADRLVVFNSSTGVVPVPTQIAGFVVDRGATGGPTKRDAPGLFWDEANSRFDLAFNTALDQSTIGAFVPLKAGAANFLSVALESGGTNYATHSLSGGYYVIQPGAGATAGLFMNVLAGEVAIEAASTFLARANGGAVRFSSSSALVEVYQAGGALTWTGTYPPTGAHVVTHKAGLTSATYQIAKNTGTGTETAAPLQLAAQDGRNVGAGTNNSGAQAVIAGGAVGTGGTGGSSAGVALKSGGLSGTERFSFNGVGAQTHTLDNWESITTTSGGLKTKIEAQGRRQTVNNTPVVPWSYVLPASCFGSVVMIVDAQDITSADDFAHYRREYMFKRRNSGAVTLTSVGTDVEVETSDTNWQAQITESGGTLSLTLTGDASNTTDFGGRVVLDITPFTPPP
jgi:hypothetical protein